MKEINVTISLKTIVIFFVSILLILGIIFIKDIILFIFAAYIIACALFPAVDILEKKMPAFLAVSLIVTALITLIATVFIPFMMILSQQLIQLNSYIPKFYQKVSEWIVIYNNSFLAHFMPSNQEILTKIFSYTESIFFKSIDITVSLFGGIVALFTLIAIVIFILADRKTIKTGFLSFFPKSKRDEVKNIADIITTRLGGYVRGQLFVMFLVGLVTGIVMYLMGIPFALLLGILAGLLEVVPIIGPILAAIPAILFALLINPILAVFVALAYLIIQRCENLITPYVYGKFLDIPPIVIISVILISGSILGVLGVILSPAIAAACYVIIQETYLKKINTEENIE